MQRVVQKSAGLKKDLLKSCGCLPDTNPDKADSHEKIQAQIATSRMHWVEFPYKMKLGTVQLSPLEACWKWLNDKDDGLAGPETEPAQAVLGSDIKVQPLKMAEAYNARVTKIKIKRKVSNTYG